MLTRSTVLRSGPSPSKPKRTAKKNGTADLRGFKKQLRQLPLPILTRIIELLRRYQEEYGRCREEEIKWLLISLAFGAARPLLKERHAALRALLTKAEQRCLDEALENGGLTNLMESEKQATNRIHVHASRGYKKFCQWAREKGGTDKETMKWLALLPLAFGWPSDALAAPIGSDMVELPSTLGTGSAPQPVRPIGGYVVVGTLSFLVLPILFLFIFLAKGCADASAEFSQTAPRDAVFEPGDLIAITIPGLPLSSGTIDLGAGAAGQHQEGNGSRDERPASAASGSDQSAKGDDTKNAETSSAQQVDMALRTTPAESAGEPLTGAEDLLSRWRRVWKDLDPAHLLFGPTQRSSPSDSGGSWWPGGTPSSSMSFRSGESPDPSPQLVADGGLPPDLAGGTITRQLGPENCQDIWTTNVYSHTNDGNKYPGGGRDDFELRVGGWGDLYWSLIQFDLTGLPRAAKSVTLELFDNGNDGAPTEMYLDRITEFWDWRTQGTGRDRVRLWWADRPATTPWRTSPLSASTRGQWYVIDITDLYIAWMAGTYPNYGIQLRPRSNMNNYNEFDSCDSGEPSRRPRVAVTY